MPGIGQEGEIRLCAGSSDRSRIELFARLIDAGIVITLFGGEKPHVGAVVLTVPRPSLVDKKKRSCNSWVIPVAAHKDDKIARPVAEMIATATGLTTVVVAGIHIHAAKTGEISKLIEHSNKLTHELIEILENC